MPLYAVIDSATGKARSFGSRLADPLPAGLEAIEIDHQPGAGEQWDPSTRSVVASEDTTPDRGAFVEAVISLLSVKRSQALNRDYGTWSALDSGTERGDRLALAGFEEMLAEADITQAEYDAIQSAWDAAHLWRPEA